MNRSRLPLVALLAVLVIAVGGVAWFSARGKAGEEAAPSAAPKASPSRVWPSTMPAEVPLSPKPPKDERRGKIVIHATGDVNVDPNYVPSFRSQGYDYAWSGMNGLFEKDDLTVINLECPITNKGRIVPKEFNFQCDPDAIDEMRKAGIEVANQANNHAYDYGPDALVDSIKNLKKGGIAPVGSGEDDTEALSPAMFDIKGWKIAVLGFDHVVDPWPTAVAAKNHPGTAAGHDVHAMLDAIKGAKRDADLVIVVIHWGVELDTKPEAYQVDMGHKFVQAGADMIFGHHAHRLQPMETYKGKPIFYGLGNFVWPDHGGLSSVTGVAEVTVSPSGREKGKILPAQISGDGHPVLR